MSMLVRMFEKQKWSYSEKSFENHDVIPADTITSDLRTKSNTLSFWLIESIDELESIVLAIATSRNQLTRLDVLILDIDTFEENQLKIINSPDTGFSPVIELNDKHFDLIELNYNKLGILSKIIIEFVENEEKSKRFNKQDITKIVYKGFLEKKFHLEELDLKLRNELEKVIEKEKAKKA